MTIHVFLVFPQSATKCIMSFTSGTWGDIWHPDPPGVPLSGAVEPPMTDQITPPPPPSLQTGHILPLTSWPAAPVPVVTHHYPPFCLRKTSVTGSVSQLLHCDTSPGIEEEEEEKNRPGGGFQYFTFLAEALPNLSGTREPSDNPLGYLKTLQDPKWLPRVHLSVCWDGKLSILKECFKFCQNLNCQIFSFWVVSQFQFLGLITVLVFEFCCYFFIFFCCWVLSQDEFWALSPFEFLLFVTI